MKRMKKIVSVLLAVIMVLGMSMTTFASSVSTGNLTVDESISVLGLKGDDTVNFYKVLEWNNGWQPAAGFSLSEDEVKAIVGTEGIDADMAGGLGLLAANAAAKYTVTASGGKAEVSGPEAGLYIAIITPAKTGYTYNPVFVAADYSRNSGNSITLAAGELSYSDESMAKLSEITLDKTASTTEDDNEDKNSGTVAAGDTVSFNIKTVIPGFADNYTNPAFYVTDTLSDGLSLKADTVTLVAPTGLAEGTDYTITPAEDEKSFVLRFTSEYLKEVKTATNVEITYDALVTTDALKSVNQEDNTVTVNFSNSPADSVGRGLLKDKTNHYTFDIDGDLFGEQPYKATEVVKIGVDKDGKEITETKELDNGKVVGALQGAEFKLYKTKAGAESESTEDLYTNSKFDGSVTSDENGRISIKGLDAGTYWLKETKAPDGYIKAQEPVSIEIIAHINENYEVKETVEGIEVTYKTNILESYEIKINGNQTASYTMTNHATTTKITSVNQGDNVVGTPNDDGSLNADGAGKIKNIQGVELPSTGGIGTTIFYVVGGILVIGAGILLVVKKRMSNR